MIRCILIAGVLLSLSACRSETETGQSATDSSDVVASLQDGEMDTTRAAPALALDPQGLRIVEPATGSTHVLPFGMDKDEVIAAVTSLRGEPGEQGVNEECGQGPLEFASWPDGLSVNFSDGRFTGWNVDGRLPGAEQHTTISGIGTGSSRAELEQAYEIRTGESSLGTEFAAGDLHGVLAGAGSNAEVTNVWSGSVCIFR